MRVRYALGATLLVLLAGLGAAAFGPALRGQALPTPGATVPRAGGHASADPFQPYPLEGPPQPQPQLSEPFYIWLEAPVAETELLEESEVKIRWRSGGPIKQVRLYYEYEKCKLAGKSRGSVGKVIGESLLPNTGERTWRVPWMDTHRLRLRIAGYDAQGGRLGTDDIGLFYRPRQLAGLPDTCIAIIKERQRLYYYEDGKVRRMHIVSTAMPGYTTPKMKPGSYDRRRGRTGQVFYKTVQTRSRLYNCVMRYWMAVTSSGSHGIHATTPNFYHRLGRPASHGCIRQHEADAKILYGLVNVGMPVYIF